MGKQQGKPGNQDQGSANIAQRDQLGALGKESTTSQGSLDTPKVKGSNSQQQARPEDRKILQLKSTPPEDRSTWVRDEEESEMSPNYQNQLRIQRQQGKQDDMKSKDMENPSLLHAASTNIASLVTNLASKHSNRHYGKKSGDDEVSFTSLQSVGNESTIAAEDNKTDHHEGEENDEGESNRPHSEVKEKLPFGK